MLTGNRFWTLAVVLGVCILATAGCRRKSSDDNTSSDDDIFTTDTFPGTEVQVGNVGDDARAMSNSGVDFGGSLQVVYNGSTGTAMATYLAGGRLYAHYYDGTMWTPPVALGALDCALLTAGGNTAVAFLNTDGFGTGFADERNGDAIILWTANDGASVVVGDGINRNLFATYFDVSVHTDISFNYGFQEFAARLSNEDDTAEDVTTFGFISDGLCGEARWNNGGDNYQWGDATSEIIAFWRTDSDNDGFAGFQSDQYWAFNRFDLDQAVADDLPLPAGATTRGPINTFGASDAGVTSEETQVYTEFISYNNVLFFKVASDGDAASGGAGAQVAPALAGYPGVVGTDDDVSVEEVAFQLNAGTSSTAVTLHAVSPSSSVGDGFESNADYAKDKGGFAFGRTNSMYGSDEGLATLTVFSQQLISDGDGDVDFGEPIADGRLRITEINEGSGSIIAGANVDGEDIDTTDPVSVFDSRISRNGDSIWVAWAENVDTGVTGPTADDHLGVWAAEYITTRIADDGTFPVPAAIGSTVSLPINLNSVIPGGISVAGFQFQTNLGYICGIQSDPDVMHLFFEHSDGTGDTVFDARLTSDLDPAGNCVPLTAVAAWEGFTLNLDQSDWALFGPQENQFDWKAVDSGEGGNVLTFYEQDIDSTATTDFRMHSEKNGLAGGKIEIDSVTSDRQCSFFSLLFLGAAEPGTDIGVFDLVSLSDDGSREHGVSTVDIIFQESQVNEADGLPVYFRTRRFASNDSTLSLGDQFEPNAGSAFVRPFYFGVPGMGTSSNTPNFITLGNHTMTDGELPVSGDVVGIYFTQGNRVYFQLSTGGSDNNLSWLNTDGVSNPFLVDDDNDEETQSVQGFFVQSCSCDTLSWSMSFWTKAFGSSSGGGLSERLQVRVLDGDNN